MSASITLELQFLRAVGAGEDQNLISSQKNLYLPCIHNTHNTAVTLGDGSVQSQELDVIQ